MTIEDFNKLTDNKKKDLLIDAEKIGEHQDEVATYELFKIDNFFVEVGRSVTYRFRKILNTHSLDNMPLAYKPK